ncbi:hypothetical protein J2T60_000631 [Natronospira proteinivora]|uniref:Uncharacterized protein n=1 Tax=Natronospira proteinivora TaxID=1807133 RepID=A0ABT1G5T5_9GAMM|nr:hypothetical protein [Natronospira proteinivora]MCP1726666.1 hypothetical protein [Natronospira proteinivora]
MVHSPFIHGMQRMQNHFSLCIERHAIGILIQLRKAPQQEMTAKRQGIEKKQQKSPAMAQIGLKDGHGQNKMYQKEYQQPGS